MTFREENRGGVILETAPNIRVKHAFTTRYGGVSEGVWSSLNLGTTRGDVPEHVDKNYDILCTAAEAGNDIALNLMNTIWEPEQIIEED